MPVSEIVLTSASDADDETLAAVAAASRFTRFFHGLDEKTKRDLVKYPPIDSEPISNMGIRMASGHHRIRRWLNNNFREHPKRKLVASDVAMTTTYAEIKAFAGV